MTTMPNTINVILIGGPYNRHRVDLTATPPRIRIGDGPIYVRLLDPDTGEFLGAYIPEAR